VLVYRSAWLKYYHPQAFYTGILNSQPMGFWSPAVVVHDAKRHNIPIYNVDIQRSEYRCQPEGKGIRLGFNYVKGIGEAAGEQIVNARAERPFTDLNDFCRRTRLPHRLVEHLIQAGGMDVWNIARRTLFWQLGLIREQIDTLALHFSEEAVTLPALTQIETASMEYGVTGLSTGPHPMTFRRENLRQQGIRSSADLSRCHSGEQVIVAGLLVVHQAPPTAKGFHFLTLEDEFGFVNVIVSPKSYVHFRQFIRSAVLFVVRGEVQQEGDVTNVLAHHFTPLR
jgi:error-prone DNA polymerase